MRFLFIIVVVLSQHISAQSKQIIFTEKALKPIGPYSQAIKSGKTLYISGQIGLKADGSLDSTSIESETKQALTNIKFILGEAKFNFKNVLKSTIYLTSLSDFKKVNAVYATFFDAEPPARETVEVKALPRGAHIEISVIAEE